MEKSAFQNKNVEANKGPNFKKSRRTSVKPNAKIRVRRAIFRVYYEMTNTWTKPINFCFQHSNRCLKSI